MHCLTAWGQWAVQLLQYTAALPGGSGQCNSCNALPHCPRAVGCGTPAMHCLTSWGQRVVQLLQCTTSLPGGSGQWNSCNALPHRLGAVGSGTPAMHCLTAWGQWAVDLLQCTASLSGAVGSATPAIHCRTAWGAVGSATPAMHCLAAWGQWAVQLLQCSASLPWGSGQRNSCNALPHCLGQRGGKIEVRNFSQFSAISQFFAIFRTFSQFSAIFRNFSAIFLSSRFSDCLPTLVPSLFWSFSCLHVCMFACACRLQCGTVSKRQHKLDDNIRRLRFMLQFHGDIEGRLL